ncbi:hypothetical protein [Pengzhenrongella sicca]|uniref:Uncharacterized protein n=1 Tax=Pengzhenrongella sicca TaxID=2819238 RepID=A0A8A4ZK17_9MICO|nr:hypothetical protein [Pengzhenrongella sicca]QTE30856.1 hypothetical protein J4E96_07985 [Pengzhenrongella sicca]
MILPFAMTREPTAADVAVRPGFFGDLLVAWHDDGVDGQQALALAAAVVGMSPK